MPIHIATAAEIRAYWREREAVCRIHRDGRVSFRLAHGPAGWFFAGRRDEWYANSRGMVYPSPIARAVTRRLDREYGIVLPSGWVSAHAIPELRRPGVLTSLVQAAIDTRTCADQRDMPGAIDKEEF